MEKKKLKWEKLNINQVLRGKGFFISYNPNTKANPMGQALDGILNFLKGVNGGGEETALVKNNKFYILDGDFRKEYEELLPKGSKVCKEFYDRNKKHYSSPFSD